MVVSGQKRVRAAVVAVVAAGLLTAVLVGPAAAAESCSYNPTTKAVTASITDGVATLVVGAGGAIQFGASPIACGAATTTNTDSISVSGSAATTETLVLDHRGGVFGPGFTSEFNTPEIEITTALGNATDSVIVYATEGSDYMSSGQNGLALNTDGDVDATFSPAAFPLTMHMLGGADHFNGRGEGGAGLHFLGDITITGGEGNDTLLRGSDQTDVIDGGPGNDVIRGEIGTDTITGGEGNDSLAGGDGPDSMTGGAGLDSFVGSSGDDTFFAQDDEADTSFNGGGGIDTLHYDEGLDPPPVAVENLIGDGGPPPPTGPCTYNAGTKAVTAAIDAGTQATLKVVGGAIHFGTTPVACGDATTLNTDSISVSGPSGSVETLTLDMSGGAFAPGAAAEGDTPEIEMTIALGDTSDRLVVNGTAGPDTFRIGQSGMALNTDADRDVTLTVLPSVVEMFGLGGPNTLSGAGGSGAGAAFLGKVILHAGDSGDLLIGGSGNDELYGGLLNDTLEANNGNDLASGGGGNDVLKGGNGDDDLTGGTGSDQFLGSSGNDIMRAGDDLADSSINGGPGTDTAEYDVGLDPSPLATEILISA